MPAAYSQDLRERLISAVIDGHSARSSAAVFKVSPSTAVKWVARWRRTGSVAADRIGGVKPSVLDGHAEFILELIGAEPGLTLHEIRKRLIEDRGVRAGVSSVWRFFSRQGISFKKNRARRRARPT